MGFDWNETTENRLRALWSEGHSTAAIGYVMEISKNAVVGKAHRLDLPARPSPIILRSGRPPAAAAHGPRAGRATLPPLPSAVPPPVAARPAIVAAPSPPAPPPIERVSPTLSLFMRPKLSGTPEEIAEVEAIWREKERRFEVVTRPAIGRCEWISGPVGKGVIPEFCGKPRYRGSYCKDCYRRAYVRAAVFGQVSRGVPAEAAA